MILCSIQCTANVLLDRKKEAHLFEEKPLFCLSTLEIMGGVNSGVGRKYEQK
jgi:hypothetical protein